MGAKQASRLVVISHDNALRREREQKLYEEVTTAFLALQVNRGHASALEPKRSTLRRLGEWISATYGPENNLTWELEMPWRWQRHQAEAWIYTLIKEGVEFSSARQYQGHIRQFSEFLCDQKKPWFHKCQPFGTPVILFDEYNSMRRPKGEVSRSEARRPYSRAQLNTIFAYTLERAKTCTGKSVYPAMRDALIWRMFYAYGPRNEGLRGLTIDDFSRNPFVGDYGDFGGIMLTEKGARGSGKRTRLVRTVPSFDWIVPQLKLYVAEIRPNIPNSEKTRALFPSERGRVLDDTYLDDRWAELRADLELDEKLVIHSFRHSYMTHLLEMGYPAKFVQMQVGHEHLGSMRTYTNMIGDEFANECLRNAHANAYRPRDPESAARLANQIEHGEDVDD